MAQETIEICELFDMNPYRLSSGECLLMAVENGGDAVKHLSEARNPVRSDRQSGKRDRQKNGRDRNDRISGTTGTG